MDVISQRDKHRIVAALERTDALKDHDREVETRTLLKHGISLAIGSFLALWLRRVRRRGA